MAIYFPKLFCVKGQRLKLKKDIVLPSGKNLFEGDICFVEDIIGYGFDIVSEKKQIEFRVINSNMNEYFYKYDEINVSHIPKIGIVALVDELTGKTQQVEIVPKFRDVLMFTKDFTIKDIVTIRHGERFYFKEDNGYFDLFDVNDGWRILRMKEKEVQHFCQLQTSPAEIEEPVY